jgi:signal transduction histidine kinase
VTELRWVSLIAFGLSLFLTFLLLWLGITTLLSVRREQIFGRLAGIALLLASGFFLSHTMIVGKGPTTSGSGMEFWWRLGWIPAVSAPLSWYATVIRYAGMSPRQQTLHRRLWWLFLGVGLLIVVLLITDNPFADYQALLVGAQSGSAVQTAPVVWLYLALNVAGFGLPVVALLSGRRERVARVRAHARPWLVGAGLALLVASVLVAGTALWAVGNALPLLQQETATVTRLLSADVAALVLIAVAAMLLGRAVVAYEVFTERALPRRGFFRRWRSVVLAAFGAAALVAGLLALEVRPLYGLTAVSLLGMTAYALFTWQSYRAHEDFISRLLPFVSSLELPERLLSAQAAEQFNQQAEALLRALCDQALGTDRADLVLEGETDRRLTYRADGVAADPIESPALCLDLASPRGTSGELLLGAKRDGSEYVAEEVELARACGGRLLDAIAGERIAQLLMELVRRRTAELQVLSTRHKRVLHDEVLPSIHAALLRLEGASPVANSDAIQALTQAHRTISGVLQSEPKPATVEIRGLGWIGALRRAMESEFEEAFAAVAWEVEPEAEGHLPAVEGGVAAEVLFFAALEAIRNAARHASGGDPLRRVALRLRIAWQDGLSVEICDNGVGLSAPASRPGGGEGLLFHSTMMAVVGGRLSLEDGPSGQGTCVQLWVPAASLLSPVADNPSAALSP